MARRENQRGPLPVYESRPPEWLPKSHATADLGYVGFFPPRPDQEEEILTEGNLKNGFIVGAQVPAENFSAQETVNSLLSTTNALSDLEGLMNMIFARKAENIPPIPPSTFKLPSRVTLNESKRQAWFNDLANPDVPLHKLGKSVPHGAKGPDLLDLMHIKNVAIPRAIWFLRVFGANETAGLRSKPNYNPTQYSVEWANVVTGYLKRQLSEIALPMAPRPGFNIKQTFKGVLSEPESRERWLSRFTYCLKLLSSFYSEGMVDNRTFLAWLVQQLAVCNLAQFGFVVRLADQYLDGMLVCRALTRPFAENCLNRLAEIRSTFAVEHLPHTESVLKNLIMRAFLALPSAFVNPRCWTQHCTLFSELVTEHVEDGPLGKQSEHNTRALRQTMAGLLADVQIRNEAMLFKYLPTRRLGSLASALADIKRLNSLSGSTDIESVNFFEGLSEDSPEFVNKLDTLLGWSVTPLQYGDHRPYAAAGLLQCWRDTVGERAIRRDRTPPDEFIHDQLFEWLDSSEIASDANNLPQIAWLFGLLVRQGLFSYERYIQRLIARGEPGLLRSQDQSSRHRDFLRWTPLHSSCPALVNQRRVTLYGARAREIPEDRIERTVRKDIRSLLPDLFGDETLPTGTLADGLETSCGSLLSAPRFEQVRIVHEWLLPLLKRSITKQSKAPANTGSSILQAYGISTALMSHCKCYLAMFELTMHTLGKATTVELLTAVVDTFRQHIEVWACLNVKKEATAALFTAHQYWKARGIQNRTLLNLLIEMDNGQILDSATRDQILADKLAYTHALQPVAEMAEAVPQALPEILMLATDTNPETPSLLANSLWYKYRTSSDWAWKVWDNTIASLRQVPVLFPDPTQRRACALRYAAFLVHVDQHVPNGLDKQTFDWFLGVGKKEIVALTTDVWDVLTVVLIYLCIQGALSTTTILEGLVYPVWRSCAMLAAPQESVAIPEVLLRAVNSICQHLLLNNQCGTEYPPANFFEGRGLRTRRRDVYREPYFALLVENIPTLVRVEQNSVLGESLRQESKSLREALCTTRIFRMGVYRDLDTVHRSFEKVFENRDVLDELREPLVNALRLMLNEHTDRTGECAWGELTSFLSPWKLAATSIEMRFTIKQLDDDLARDVSRAKAIASVSSLTKAIYQGITSEEGEFVAEMLKEVSAPVATKFIDAGLREITKLLEPLTVSKAEEMEHFVTKAGEILRLTARITKPLRDASSVPELESSVTDRLFSALNSRLTAIKDLLSTERKGPSTNVNIAQTTQTTIFVVRLVQFVLGFPGVWTQTVKQLTAPFTGTLVQLAVIFGSGLTIDHLAFPIVVDTLCYVLDEQPADSKVLTFDPFKNYPIISLSELPSDMPREFYQRMRSLLPFVDVNHVVKGLAYAVKDASGNWNYSVPVQNRPWEWTENIGDISPSDTKAEVSAPGAVGIEDHCPFKNSASLSLDLFGAKLTGEKLIQHGKYDFKTEQSLRMLQDGFASDSVYERAWREGWVPSSDNASNSDKSEQDGECGPLPAFSNNNAVAGPSAERRSSSLKRESPASVGSGISRGGMRQSPMLGRFSGSTAGDAIDVDAMDIPATHGKRKMSEEDGDEIVDVSSKKAKGRAGSSLVASSARPKVKKR